MTHLAVHRKTYALYDISFKVKIREWQFRAHCLLVIKPTGWLPLAAAREVQGLFLWPQSPPTKIR